MRMQITFKGGAQIEVDVEKYTIGRDNLTDALTSLN